MARDAVLRLTGKKGGAKVGKPQGKGIILRASKRGLGNAKNKGLQGSDCCELLGDAGGVEASQPRQASALVELGLAWETPMCWAATLEQLAGVRHQGIWQQHQGTRQRRKVMSLDFSIGGSDARIGARGGNCVVTWATPLAFETTKDGAKVVPSLATPRRLRGDTRLGDATHVVMLAGWHGHRGCGDTFGAERTGQCQDGLSDTGI
ncbi:unnamed protein product [Ilex paraguariensis]|uniref:Uncharacterized protein n=1 Tax=Ilex paraguariensis TaxID=185542 RepID=A0ABC8RD28_9AQUA